MATGSWPRPVEVLADACRFFETPVTGGNVSLYNETLDSQGNPQPIYPTPVVGMVGRIDDLTKTVGQGWQQPGDIVYLLGIAVGQTATAQVEGRLLVTLGGSEYLATLHQQVTGHPPPGGYGPGTASAAGLPGRHSAGVGALCP